MLKLLGDSGKSELEMATHLQGGLGGVVHHKTDYSKQNTYGAVQVVDENERVFVSHLNRLFILGVVNEKFCKLVELSLVRLVVIFNDPGRVVFVVFRDVYESRKFYKECEDGDKEYEAASVEGEPTVVLDIESRFFDFF